MGCIYKATSKTTHKCYVGQTKRTLEERKAEHYKLAQKPQENDIFHLALHNEDFEWEILEFCDDAQLFKREVKWSLQEHAYIPEGLAPKPVYFDEANQSLWEDNEKILCVERNVVFNTIQEAATFANVGAAAIKTAIKKETTCGKFNDGLKCHWRYTTPEENQAIVPDDNTRQKELKLISVKDDIVERFKIIQQKQYELNQMMADFEEMLERIGK